MHEQMSKRRAIWSESLAPSVDAHVANGIRIAVDWLDLARSEAFLAECSPICPFEWSIFIAIIARMFRSLTCGWFSVQPINASGVDW